MLKQRKMLTFLIAFMLMGSMAPAQGWVITDADGSKTLISDGWIKTIDPEGESYLSMFNVETGELIIINSDEEVYAEGTIREYCAAIRTMEEQMKESMSDDQRKMMEEFMESQEKTEEPEVEIQKAGTEEIAGYTADKYRVIVDGVLYEEVWLSSAGELQDLVTLANHMDEMISEMVECSMYTELGNDPESTEEYMEMMKKGMELKSVDHEYGEAETTSEVLSIERERIDKGEFDPPSGFRKVSLADIMLMQ